MTMMTDLDVEKGLELLTDNERIMLSLLFRKMKGEKMGFKLSINSPASWSLNTEPEIDKNYRTSTVSGTISTDRITVDFDELYREQKRINREKRRINREQKRIK